MEVLTEVQKEKLAGLQVWLNLRAGDVLEWRRELLDRRAVATVEENRELMIRVMMRQVAEQLGEIPLDHWADQQVRVYVILPLALDRIDDLTRRGCTVTHFQMARQISDAISEALLSVDWLPPAALAELEQSHALVRDEIDKLIQAGS